MKTLVRIFALILSFSALLMAFASCGKKDKDDVDNSEQPDNAPKSADYTVTVIDCVGNPVSDVMIEYKDASGENKKKVTGKDGIANLKNAVVGEDMTVGQGFSSAEILQSKYKLEPDKNTIRVVVRNLEKSVEISGEIEDGQYASAIVEGEYNVPGVKNKIAYFVFTTNQKGVYKVTLESSDNAATVAYYGIPMFVQTTHRGEGEYDGKSFEVIIQDPNTPYVFGINFVNGDDAKLKIERIGDAPFDPQYAPWTIVEVTEEFKTFNTGTLTDLDIEDPTLSVSLGDDGYYYTSDGKLVSARVNSTTPYLDVSIAYISGFVDKNFGQNFGGYVYNDDGTFKAKYSYNEMIGAYYENCDGNGVYPLTAELAEAIKCHGESAGWWNPNSANYRFSGKVIVEENAWLFLCCTEVK